MLSETYLTYTSLLLSCNFFYCLPWVPTIVKPMSRVSIRQQRLRKCKSARNSSTCRVLEISTDPSPYLLPTDPPHPSIPPPPFPSIPCRHPNRFKLLFKVQGKEKQCREYCDGALQQTICNSLLLHKQVRVSCSGMYL